MTPTDIIGLYLEGFLYGLYSGIFAIYLQDHWTSKKGTDKTKNIVFYALCALYVLSFVNVVLDITMFVYVFHWNPTALLHASFIQGTVTGCCDFIAQSILVYRCWIVWGCNIRVVIVPSISAFVFLGMWLSGNASHYIFSGQVIDTGWGNRLSVASVAMSMTVNALVTGLIIFKIFNVYREVKSSDNQTLGVTRGGKIRAVIFVLIESGMMLFSIQTARLVVIIFHTVGVAYKAFYIIVAIHQMLNGLTPTIILVRVSMGLSFYDKESMIESSVGSLRFAADNPNSIPETGDIENRDDVIGVRLSDDIEMVER